MWQVYLGGSLLAERRSDMENLTTKVKGLKCHVNYRDHFLLSEKVIWKILQPEVRA